MPGPAPRARRGFDRLAYREPRPQPWLIHALGPVNRRLVLGPWLGLRRIVLPDADAARLRAALDPGTCAFVGPNHPEFTTDWLLDKEISRRFAPLMAHWASYEIVNASPLAQRFWLANNLIANAPGGGGKAYSARWALAGHGVLLHPEGTATWQAERVGALLPGIVDMAWDAALAARAAHASREVYVVPVVWRLHFAGDPAAGLAREMATIERALGLPAGAGPPEVRFASLVGRLLASRCAHHGLPAPAFDPAAPGRDYFAAQSRAIGAIRARFTERNGELDASFTRAQHQLRRAIRRLPEHEAERARAERRLLQEWQWLEGFDPALYDVPAITREQIAENLKRIRAALVTRGLSNTLHNVVPVAVAPRIVHVRAPEPLRIVPGDAAEGAETAKTRLLRELHTRMQAGVDALGVELSAEFDRGRRPNPLVSR